MVVDLDAAPHSQARLFCQPGRRADADGHHHDVRRNFGAVLQPYRFHLCHADNLSSIRAREDLLAAPFQLGLQQPARRLVQLTLHQGRHQVEHGDLHAPKCKPVGRLQAQQATADDHRIPPQAAAASILSTSSRSRKVTTPGRSLPGTGMMNGSDPVAISSLL
jgi:hypothetical protein